MLEFTLRAVRLACLASRHISRRGKRCPRRVRARQQQCFLRKTSHSRQGFEQRQLSAARKILRSLAPTDKSLVRAHLLLIITVSNNGFVVPRTASRSSSTTTSTLVRLSCHPIQPHRRPTSSRCPAAQPQYKRDAYLSSARWWLADDPGLSLLVLAIHVPDAIVTCGVHKVVCRRGLVRIALVRVS